MYYNITKGELRLNNLISLNKYLIEDHSKKLNPENSKYFSVFKIEEGKNFIWLRIENRTGLIKSLQRPDKINEYGFIIDFLEINPNLIIKDDHDEVMHYDVVKELYFLKNKIISQL